MKNDNGHLLQPGAPLLSPLQNTQAEYSSIKINPIPDTITIVDSANIVVLSNFGPEAQILRCPYCQYFTTTHVKSKPTIKTHLLALLACFGCTWLCCCFPYCIGFCNDRHHYCSQCNAYLGSYRT